MFVGNYSVRVRASIKKKNIVKVLVWNTSRVFEKKKSNRLLLVTLHARKFRKPDSFRWYTVTRHFTVKTAG